MDLRAMLNTDGGAAPAPAKQQTVSPARPPPPSPIRPPPPGSIPSTPIQPMPPQTMRDYSHVIHASPGRSNSHDYAAQQTPGAFASPSTYPLHPSPYSRQMALPLQQHGTADLRSPKMVSAPGPLLFRQTPSGSMSSSSGGYPFPTAQPQPTSPVQQRQQYPPSAALSQRDIYPQPPGPVGMTGPPGSVYMQGQPMPQTPPVATSGSGHPYLHHQRSQSTHSTTTPTSTHSQPPQQGGPFVQGSPVASHHHPPPPQPHDVSRHPSQPSTPHGTPLSVGQRGAPVSNSYVQPSSPYQQRLPSSGTLYNHSAHTSPVQPPPSVIPKPPSSQDPNIRSAHQRSISHSDRGHSQSVSPRTRVPSLPNSTGNALPAYEADPRLARSQSTLSNSNAREKAMPPAKRKLDDRDLRPEELEKREQRPPPFPADVNGTNHTTPPAAARTAAAPPSDSPTARRNKKPRPTTPVWGKSFEGGSLKQPNFVLRKGKHDHLNGLSEHGRRDSGEPSKATSTQPSAPAQGSPPHLLSPWEPTITNLKPVDALTKMVADFIWIHVVQNQDYGSIQAFGVQFEIEAKFGTLVSKDTNARVEFPVKTECILEPNSRISFQSTMTEKQHQNFNEFLNRCVFETSPRHPSNMGSAKPRVPIQYQHRREMDRFYELPIDLQDTVPPPIRSLVQSRHGRKAIKVRLTHDQKTGTVIAKIVKARVADLDIYMPGPVLDCRISINLELPWEGAVEDLEQLNAGNREKMPDRNKDRLSYQHSHYQVDLTQVTQQVPGANGTYRSDREHELEVELDAYTVLDQTSKLQNGEANAFPELIEGFVDNIRVLSRKVGEWVM